MRKIVLQMMTTVNGRLDDPDAWVSGIDEAQYKDIDQLYGTFDTILVGKTTYKEMYEYWPAAENDENESETTRSMAQKMNAYKKYVISDSTEDDVLKWYNAEHICLRNDDEMRQFAERLKREPGRDIHLSGGARLAQSMVRLGLVDEYRLFMYPTISKGMTWFDQVEDGRDMRLIDVTTYSNGVIGMCYRPKAA